jgi:formate--tetrahydrofolate ligase
MLGCLYTAMRHITDVAHALGLAPNSVVLYGPGVAKIPTPVVRAHSERPRGKLVLVTAMTPTSAGEGKTVTAIGTAMALAREGLRAIPVLRQPSLGPVFGAKGGATGGGKATVEPSAEINLGLTGDLYAVATAQNLLASLVDNHLHHGNSLGIDPERISLPRTIDLDDRALRGVRVGTGGKGTAPERADRFVIAAASEVAAIQCLSRDPEDLQRRLGAMTIGFTQAGKAVTASDLGGGGAMAAIMRHAIEPNLVQTCEGTPALVHAGPFANLGPGTASVSAIRLALSLSDYVMVEAGFASDLGAEKFVDLVGPVGGFSPVAAILVATVAALRHHARESPDEPIAKGPEVVRRGLGNLAQHVANLKAVGLDPVIAINIHPDDQPAELDVLEAFCQSEGLRYARSTVYSSGSAGASNLARVVREAADHGHPARPVVSPAHSLTKKMETVAKTFYGAAGISLLPRATADLELLAKVGLDPGPLCMAKTQLSLSDDARKLGAPTGFTVSVHRLDAWTGAGFAVAHLGQILAMPGLPEHPAAVHISVNAQGEVTGLS